MLKNDAAIKSNNNVKYAPLCIAADLLLVQKVHSIKNHDYKDYK